MNGVVNDPAGFDRFHVVVFLRVEDLDRAAGPVVSQKSVEHPFWHVLKGANQFQRCCTVGVALNELVHVARRSV